MAGKGGQKGRGKDRSYGVTSSAYPEASRDEGSGGVSQLTAEPEQTAKPRQAKGSAVLTHEQIAERAEAIWIQRGRPSGEDESIWYEAESQLKQELGIQ